ncbi:Colicin I receptor precursor [Lacunisphaera limnophila]|uniref:Colicin I receptor n=1 Tax=Lacunisphaera limnophila TaxID=1838286 RepID=A0A1I7PHS2_9BACT|nr:TonB-dependent receptor [Lacunisphaera limnophila]AOS43165.1 Colicin I receptor precursor [Lacunisphaera limnophila]
MRLVPGRQRRGSWAGRSPTWLALLLLSVSLPGRGRAGDETVLTELTFEQLGQIIVTTASKRPEPLADTAAAISVLTGAELHNLGVTSVPQALRGITGLNVAQINGASWGIGARGFSGQFATKLLVMIDGRSVYTPVFGGVFWDTQNYLPEDIDRIEVVLGNGGSLWGANAVNGVINILTKDAKDTQGDLLAVSVGTRGSGMVSARHGAKLAPAVFGRVYVNYRTTASTIDPGGSEAGDATRFLQGGWRVDGTRGNARWTLQSDAYQGWNDYRITLPSLAVGPPYQFTDETGESTAGGNLLGRWETSLDSGDSLQAMAYLDYAERKGPLFENRTRTVEVDMQHTLTAIGRHELTWGLSARQIDIQTRDRWISYLSPPNSLWLASAFAQDKITLIRDRLNLNAGLKLEGGSRNRTEQQPSLRLAWLPTPNQVLWTSWARAARTPALTENYGVTYPVVLPPGALDPQLPAAVRATGTPGLDVETLHSLEAGWRWQVTDSLNLALTGYLNDYDDLIEVNNASPFVEASPQPVFIIPAVLNNDLTGQTHGGEITMHWQPVEQWHLTVGYAYTLTRFARAGPDDLNIVRTSGNTPRQSASVSTTWTPVKTWQFTGSLRYVDRSTSLDIPAYVDFDFSLAWHPNPQWEIALTGQNVLHEHHLEGKPGVIGPTAEIPRVVALRLTWKR